MSRFAYPLHQQPARVTWGTGSTRTLAGTPWNERTLVFTTGQEAIVERLRTVLAKQGIDLEAARVIPKPPGEPTIDMIEAGARAFLDGPVTRIVGFGGGSVLDWCRLALARALGALDLLTGRIVNAEALGSRPELWLVPTTCATGAEAAGIAVYLDELGKKVPVISPTFVADHVVLDGQYLAGISPADLSGFLGDSLTHAVEGFVSIVPGTFAKEAALSAARLIVAHAGSAASPSRNERLMEAGFLGGVAAANCSVGVVHAFSHSVARLGVPHGYGNAIALDAGIAANADVPAMSELANRLGFGSVDRMRTALASVLADVWHPSFERLAEALATPEQRVAIIESMTHDVCLRSNPKRLDSPELDHFLEAVASRTSSVLSIGGNAS